MGGQIEISISGVTKCISASKC